MWWDWNSWGGLWAGMIIMMVLMVIFWGGIIALIVWGIRRFARRESGRGTAERPSPLDLAKERYARGEITKEQFEQIKKDLS